MQPCSLTLTLFFSLQLLNLCLALPEFSEKIYSAFGLNADDAVMATFLVTFKNADVSGAHDPKVMFNVAHVRGEKSAEGVKSIDEFEINGGYHEMRGIFVYEQLISQHRDTRKLIRSRLPDARIVSNIPVSNSFILMLTKKDLEKVLNMQEVIEVNMNQAFRVDIPVADPLASTDLCDPDSLVSPKSGPLAALPIEKNLQNENENNTEKHLARDILPLNVQWNINKIRANVVWDAYQTQGQGMLYAIADTGVEWTHPNIRQNYAGINGDGTVNHNYAWFDGVRGLVSGGNFIRKEGSYHHGEGGKCGYKSREPCDDQGHGTHVASTAVGCNGYGVAPGARWIACRNMDRGVGSAETYLNCLNFFLAPHDLDRKNPDPSRRPHAVGNSYGCTDKEGCPKTAMTNAVEALRASGIFMSVSAGNEGPNCGTVRDPPALEPSVVSVGATDSNDQLAVFSSRGPCSVIPGMPAYRKPDLSAPGVQITAAYPGGKFKSLSGTSMASPHVGGSALLIASACPRIARNINLIQEILEKTAIPLKPEPPVYSGIGRNADGLCGTDGPDSIPNNFFGWGRIDVLSAVVYCSNMPAHL